MQSIIMLSINGSTFFLEDQNFTIEQKQILSTIAKENIYYSSMNNDEEILKQFIEVARNKLKINLKNIKISLVIRIDKN